jgi:hypothetical protein
MRSVLKKFLLFSTLFILAPQPMTAKMAIWAVGSGRESCASWLQDRAHFVPGQAWIMGYWTGLNVANTENHNVGEKTDGAAILEEVRRICEREPSLDLMDAVGKHYDVVRFKR